MNTAIITRTGGSQGISFAVPVNLAREVMERLVAERKGEAWLPSFLASSGGGGCGGAPPRSAQRAQYRRDRDRG
jgi:S1-C subfamily serine protease